MGKNGASGENTVNLSGWEFRKVKDGLDETQVAAIVSELVKERNDLLKRLEHLSSLTQLAEKTVAEADSLAENIKAKAQREATTEASSIISQARTQAEQVAGETRRLQLELGGSVQDLISELISVTDSLRQRLGVLKLEAERRLSPQVEADNSQARVADEGTADWSPAADGSENPGMELEILPPLDIMKIMDIVTYLDSLPEIGNTELIPNPERPSIIVSLRKPIPLVDMLRSLPEIAHVATTTTTDGEVSQRKVQITLSESAIPQKT